MDNTVQGTQKARQLWVVLPLLLVLALALLASACAGGPASTPIPSPTPLPTPTPTPPPDPRAILERAAERLLAERSLAFTLEHPSGGAPLSPGLLLSRAEGVINSPVATSDNMPATTLANTHESFRVNLEMEASGSILEIGVIVVGEEAFMTDIFSGQWAPVAKEQIPFRFDNVVQTLAVLTAGVQSPVLAGEERSEDGYAAYHLQGAVPATDLAGLVPGAASESDVPVDLWVEREKGRLRQVTLTGPVAPYDPPETVRVLFLEHLETPAEIEAPVITPPGQ